MKNYDFNEASWFHKLTDREQQVASHAIHYAENYPSAGIPGSNHILLIAKLVELLDEKEETSAEVDASAF